MSSRLAISIGASPLPLMRPGKNRLPSDDEASACGCRRIDEPSQRLAKAVGADYAISHGAVESGGRLDGCTRLRSCWRVTARSGHSQTAALRASLLDHQLIGENRLRPSPLMRQGPPYFRLAAYSASASMSASLTSRAALVIVPSISMRAPERICRNCAMK